MNRYFFNKIESVEKLGKVLNNFLNFKVHDWIKTLARTVRFAWSRDEDRLLLVDEDREKIDTMAFDLYNKALNEYFDNTDQGLREAMREFWLLGHAIDFARLK